MWIFYINIVSNGVVLIFFISFCNCIYRMWKYFSSIVRMIKIVIFDCIYNEIVLLDGILKV